MIDLVTLEQAKDHLRMKGIDDADDDILDKISQASAIILDYLKIPEPEEVSPPTSPPTYDMSETWPPFGITPYNIQAATLLVVAELFEKREASEADVLSQTVCDLLCRKRDPALA